MMPERQERTIKTKRLMSTGCSPLGTSCRTGRRKRASHLKEVTDTETDRYLILNAQVLLWGFFLGGGGLFEHPVNHRRYIRVMLERQERTINTMRLMPTGCSPLGTSCRTMS